MMEEGGGSMIARRMARGKDRREQQERGERGEKRESSLRRAERGGSSRRRRDAHTTSVKYLYIKCQNICT